MGTLIKELPLAAEMYNSDEPSTYTVCEHTLNSLLKSEIILDVMMKHGVHLWEGFDACMCAVQLELKGAEENT